MTRLVRLSKPVTVDKVRRAIAYRVKARPGNEYAAVLQSLAAWMDYADRTLSDDATSEERASMVFYEADEVKELAQIIARLIADWWIVVNHKWRDMHRKGDDE